MKQYNSIKAKYPDALLLFRVGDFYETFGEDAIKAASILGIVLTKRANGYQAYMELAGFPYHSLDNYLPKLVRAGYRVAICDQLEDPKATKTIVKRGVTELVTPGVAFNEKILEHKSNNFLASVHFNEDSRSKSSYTCGVSFLDVSTGEFLVAQGNPDYTAKLLQSFKPSEVLYQKNQKKLFTETFGAGFYTYGLDEWIFTADFGNEILLKHFGTVSLKGFGIENLQQGIIAAGASMQYLAETNHERVRHISSISRIEEDHYVWLDKFTIRNLELLSSSNENAKTLTDILDHTCTPMGSRLMKRWIILPLKNKTPIIERQDAVQHLLKDTEKSASLREILQDAGDLERLISRVAAGRVTPRDLLQLRRSLGIINPVKNLLETSGNPALTRISEQLNPCQLILERLEREIKEDAPLLISKGNVIKDGVNKELDQLRAIAYTGKDYLISIQQKESERTGIPSLKIAFNNVFGYYLEVTHTHKSKVPSDWIRKQTLVNAERYITEELKQYEEKILGAEDKIFALETKLFNDLVLALQEYIVPVQLNASQLAKLDCLLSFADIAFKNNYTRPEITEENALEIKEGRHPVIEKQLPAGQDYISNDIYLDSDSQQIIIITGPNMSGKSAILRQTALITLMAQMGSYVPASHAVIGLVDKIFTRVGASDNISSGESTFMVEMNETASILNNLSDKSLILLDEIGRGTSTYDGISIAWAIAEFLHENNQARPKTLFATHYHELNAMATSLKRIRNFNVAVKEASGKVHFLRKLVAGGSEHSFGIHVARMAGMPVKVLSRAKEILKHLESTHGMDKSSKIAVPPKEDLQLSFFQLDDPVLEQIKEEIMKTDINNLTPVEALMKLNDIKKLLVR